MIYFVATPIGNLEDITLRALKTLKFVDIIACEDTRVSKKLLTHFDIRKKTISFHKFNEVQSCEKIIELNNQGNDIAIISDAGMPAISDPGNILTKMLSEREIDFTIIPGPNAALSALILSGLDTSSFYFLGFLPTKKGEQKKVLQETSFIKSTLIFYLSPHKLTETLSNIHSILGSRKCALVKEITKIYEKVYRFCLGDHIFISNNEEDKKKAPADTLIVDSNGEFVLIVEGAMEEKNFDSIVDHVKFYINLGMSKNEAIKKVASERNVRKDVVYKEVLQL